MKRPFPYQAPVLATFKGDPTLLQRWWQPYAVSRDRVHLVVWSFRWKSTSTYPGILSFVVNKFVTWNWEIFVCFLHIRRLLWCVASSVAIRTFFFFLSSLRVFVELGHGSASAREDLEDVLFRPSGWRGRGGTPSPTYAAAFKCWFLKRFFGPWKVLADDPPSGCCWQGAREEPFFHQNQSPSLKRGRP